MKKLITIILLSSLTYSCGDEKTTEKENTKVLSKGSEFSNTNVEEYTYQGCEYIKVGSTKYHWGSHKGNCKNHPICNSDSVQILKEELKKTKNYVKKLEEENKLMGSYLGYYESKYPNND